MRTLGLALLTGTLLLSPIGCTNMNKTQQGAMSGAALGALAGGGISAIAGGSGTMGALVGGGLGVIAGSIYGHNKDKR